MNDDWHYNQQQDPQSPYSSQPQRRMSPMVIASLVCGVIGLFCIITGFFAIFFGSLAILFSFLAKGSKPKAERPAIYGRIVGIIAAVIGAIMIIYSMSVLRNEYGSLENFYNSYTIDQFYGTDDL